MSDWKITKSGEKRGVPRINLVKHLSDGVISVRVENYPEQPEGSRIIAGPAVHLYASGASMTWAEWQDVKAQVDLALLEVSMIGAERKALNGEKFGNVSSDRF